MLDEVSLLLGAMPGIAVLGRRIQGRNAVFDLISLGATSSYFLQRLCVAADVAIEPCDSLEDPVSSAGSLRHFSLSASTSPFAPFELGNLQLLGIHLVRHLNQRGMVPAQAATRFLQRWNATPLGE